MLNSRSLNGSARSRRNASRARNPPTRAATNQPASTSQSRIDRTRSTMDPAYGGHAARETAESRRPGTTKVAHRGAHRSTIRDQSSTSGRCRGPPGTRRLDRMITTHGLCKSYGRSPVVHDVSFDCQPGTITGFLGPNGAGKSTTLRMITGLTRPDTGTATIGGRRYADLGTPARVVGTLLDASAMHPGRTGRATLKIAADLAGVDPAEVGRVLDQVGLAGKAADRRVGAYSLGMRQRLGIGQALIGQPRALILDEPANGLDPDGIAWMRTLLRDFADRGGTVLLSSHLLGEVQATVDRLVVIGG